MSCARHLYRIRASASRRDPLSAQNKNSFRWRPHTEESSYVCQKEVGRPSVSKKRTLFELACESDPESRDEDEEKATKKTYCDIFRTVTENLHLLDEELPKVLCCKICFYFGLIFIDDFLMT